MWTLFVANLDPQLRDVELAEFFRKSIGGADVYSAQVVLDRESSESKNFGYVHYTNEKSYKEALDEYPEVEIHGRLAKCFAAEDKRKVYVRGIPRDISDSKLHAELEDIAGKFLTVNIRAGQNTHRCGLQKFIVCGGGCWCHVLCVSHARLCDVHPPRHIR